MINPEKYEYLWTDYDVNFVFTSCYLFKEFRMTDIVLIYDFKDKGLRFFLAKEDRKKFSDYGVEFYKKEFFRWKQEIVKNILEGKKLIKDTNKNNIHLMND